MPDEHVYSMKSDVINVNFTSDLLRDLARINRSRKNSTVTSGSSNKNTHFTFTNCTGIDVKIGLISSADHDDKEISARCVKDGECARLCPGTAGDLNSISLHADHQTALSKLPLKPSGRSVFLYKWPSSIADQIYELEPVVESVIQNQRLRSSVADVFSLDRGMDLLSSTIWSPSANDTLSKLLWQKPYLDGDAPEFSDMTCRFKQPKESIRLPGREWVWVNDWEVEINDGNDADGWEYSDDFETFKAGERRLYKRGDACKLRCCCVSFVCFWLTSTSPYPLSRPPEKVDPTSNAQTSRKRTMLSIEVGVEQRQGWVHRDKGRQSHNAEQQNSSSSDYFWMVPNLE